MINILSYVVAALVLWLVFSMLKNPVMLKMSFKNAFRRKAETLLVILGSLIGTALIVMNDSFQKFLYAQVEHSLGEIDEVLKPGDGKPYFDAEKLKEQLAWLEGSTLIDGVLPAITKNITIGIPGETRKLTPGKTMETFLIGINPAEVNSFGSKGGSTDVFEALGEKSDGYITAI